MIRILAAITLLAAIYGVFALPNPVVYIGPAIFAAFVLLGVDKEK